MDTLDELKAKLRPLVGAVVFDGDLFIFPTEEPENLLDTDTILYLSTATGAVAIGLDGDGQTPRVEYPPSGLLRRLPTLPRQVGLADRRRVWQSHSAANAWAFLTGHERFALTGFPDLARALRAPIEQVSVYAFADDQAPTGIKLVFPDVIIHSVAGAGGNLVRSGELGSYFTYPVIEHPV